MRVFDRQHIRQRDQIAYSFHLFEQFGLRICLFGYFFDPPIVFLNSLVQRFDLSKQRLQNLAQLRAQSRAELSAYLNECKTYGPSTKTEVRA